MREPQVGDIYHIVGTSSVLEICGITSEKVYWVCKDTGVTRKTCLGDMTECIQLGLLILQTKSLDQYNPCTPKSKCECGATIAGAPIHSDWCPLS